MMDLKTQFPKNCQGNNYWSDQILFIFIRADFISGGRKMAARFGDTEIPKPPPLPGEGGELDQHQRQPHLIPQHPLGQRSNSVSNLVQVHEKHARQSAGSKSYAAASDALVAKDYQLKIHYRRSGPFTNTALNNEEKARLIFNFIQVPAGKCMGIDDSRRDRLVLIIHHSVPLWTLNLSQSFDIRDGLSTKPVATVLKEKDVMLYNLPWEVEHGPIEEILKLFGVITKPLERMRYHIDDNAPDFVKKLNGIPRGDLICKMKMTKPVPNFIVLGDRKVKVVYDKQPKSCGRCFQLLHECPAFGRADKCEEKFQNGDEDGVSRGNLQDYWRKAVDGLSPHDVSVSSSDSLSQYAGDRVDIVNCPEESNTQSMILLLKSSAVEVKPEQVVQSESDPKKWSVLGLLPTEIKNVVDLLDKRIIGTNKVRVYCVFNSTPKDNSTGERTGETGGGSPTLDPPQHPTPAGSEIPGAPVLPLLNPVNLGGRMDAEMTGGGNGEEVSHPDDKAKANNNSNSNPKGDPTVTLSDSDSVRILSNTGSTGYPSELSSADQSLMSVSGSSGNLSKGQGVDIQKQSDKILSYLDSSPENGGDKKKLSKKERKKKDQEKKNEMERKAKEEEERIAKLQEKVKIALEKKASEAEKSEEDDVGGGGGTKRPLTITPEKTGDETGNMDDEEIPESPKKIVEPPPKRSTRLNSFAEKSIRK